MRKQAKSNFNIKLCLEKTINDQIIFFSSLLKVRVFLFPLFLILGNFAVIAVVCVCVCAVCVFTFCFWPVWLNKLATQSRLIAYLKCRLCYKTGAHFAHTGAEQSGIEGEWGREGEGR